MSDATFSRTLARTAAVQCLYALDSKGTAPITEADVELALKSINKYYKSHEAQGPELNHKFLSRIVHLAVQHGPALASLVAANSKSTKPTMKTNSMLRTILKCGACELMHFKTPSKVIIDEYVKLTKDFMDDEEVGFVNAVLDKVARARPAQL